MVYDQEAYHTQQIEMQYREVMQKADRLEALANKLSRKAANETRNLSDDIRRQWEGEEAEVFLRKSSLVESEISQTVKGIRDCADVIRQMARQMMEAEMEAARAVHKEGIEG